MTSLNWITKDNYESILQEYKGDCSLKVLGITTESAVPAGDNYTSNVYRVKITYSAAESGTTSKTADLIVKCFPVDKIEISKMVEDARMFEKEIEMYTNILPRMYSILDELQPSYARCVFTSDKPIPTIMFEDISVNGFRMCKRHNGLDFDQCLLVAKKIAELHALSLVLTEKDLSSFRSFNNGLFVGSEGVKPWLECCFQAFIDLCSKEDDFKQYVPKLRRLKNNVLEKTAEAGERKLGTFSVLNHGDAWTNNIMFSYDKENNVTDLKLIDFQLCIYTSPAIDLHYFWASSPQINFKTKKYLDLFLNYYYTYLLNILSRLGYSLERIPSRKMFLKDWKNRAFYGFLTSISVLPWFLCPKRDDASFDDFMSNGEMGGFRYDCYNNSLYKKHMDILLPMYDKLGGLDL